MRCFLAAAGQACLVVTPDTIIMSGINGLLVLFGKLTGVCLACIRHIFGTGRKTGKSCLKLPAKSAQLTQLTPGFIGRGRTPRRSNGPARFESAGQAMLGNEFASDTA